MDCQKQQAPEPPSIQPQLEANKVAQPKQEALTTADPQKQQSLLVDTTIKAAEVIKKEDKSSPAQSQKPTAVQSAQQSSPDTPAVVKKAEPSKEEKSLFSFSAGSAKSPSPQLDISAVSGKARGFGSSLFSSASNLISSALQDEPSTTPPTSGKGSTISQRSEKDGPIPDISTKGAIARKEEEKVELKIKSDDQTTVSPSLVEKDEHLNKPLKPCPLCKVALIKDPPNYDTCTECKTTVCNLCGFSSMPQQTEVSI